MKLIVISLCLMSTCAYGVFPGTKLYLQNKSSWDINYKSGDIYQGKLQKNSGNMEFIGSLEDAINHGLSVNGLSHGKVRRSVQVNFNEAKQLASKNPETPLVITISRSKTGRCICETKVQS